MNAPLYQFRWTLPDTGYEVIETPWTDEDGKKQKRQRFVAERMDLSNRKAWTYAPLEAETGLFREFAVLYPADEEKVLAFANKYGWLGIEHYRIDRGTYPGSTLPIDTFPWQFGEALHTWRYHVERMHHLLRLWRAATDHDHTALAEYIEWENDADTGRLTSVSYREPSSGLGIVKPCRRFRLIASEDRRPELFGDFTRGDYVGPALRALQLEINDILQKHPTDPCLLWDPKKQRMGLYMSPTTLRGAIWLQFAQAIQGNKLHRQCEQCRRWFEVGAQVREDAKFCQQSCRSKAYRERRKEARQLHESGLSFREIAKRFDTKVTIVKGWIK